MRYCSELEASVTSDKKSNEFSTGKKSPAPKTSTTAAASAVIHLPLCRSHLCFSYLSSHLCPQMAGSCCQAISLRLMSSTASACGMVSCLSSFNSHCSCSFQARPDSQWQGISRFKLPPSLMLLALKGHGSVLVHLPGQQPSHPNVHEVAKKMWSLPPCRAAPKPFWEWEHCSLSPMLWEKNISLKTGEAVPFQDSRHVSQYRWERTTCHTPCCNPVTWLQSPPPAAAWCSCLMEISL